MDSNEFELLVAAILEAGANAGRDKGSMVSGSSAFNLYYTVEKLREYGFTHGDIAYSKP